MASCYELVSGWNEQKTTRKNLTGWKLKRSWSCFSFIYSSDFWPVDIFTVIIPVWCLTGNSSSVVVKQLWVGALMTSALTPDLWRPAIGWWSEQGMMGSCSPCRRIRLWSKWLLTGWLRSLNTSLSLLWSHVTHLQLLCLSYHNWRKNDWLLISTLRMCLICALKVEYYSSLMKLWRPLLVKR